MFSDAFDLQIKINKLTSTTVLKLIKATYSNTYKTLCKHNTVLIVAPADDGTMNDKMVWQKIVIINRY